MMRFSNIRCRGWTKKGKDEKPFFCWFNTTAIHIWSHPQNKYVQQAVDEGRAEQDVVRAKMLEHDEQVVQLLQETEGTGRGRQHHRDLHDGQRQ